MQSISPHAIIILGPTAGGKTRFALDLAQALPAKGECIAADSMQIYRGMDIGTAKPTAAEQDQVAHHLIDFVDPSDDGFTVETWLNLCEQTIDEIRGRGRQPIIVGGTNLYIKAFLDGLFKGPDPDLQLREQLHSLSNETLRGELLNIDPSAAERIHPNDRKRTIRAIEVHRLTGERISDLQQQWESKSTRENVTILGLDWPPPEINRRINARVKRMIELGLVDEVRQLHETNSLGTQSREALGYKQVIDYLEDRCSLDTAIEQIKIKSRRYAKQQRTWLRRFRTYPDSCWFPADKLNSQQILKRALRTMTG